MLSDLVQDMSLRGAQRKKAPAFDGAPPVSKPAVEEVVKAPPPPPPPPNTSGARHETALRGRRALSETDRRAAATGQGPLTLEFGGLRVTVERSDGVSTIAGGRVERRHATVRSPRRRKARQPLHVTGNSTGSPVRRSTAPVKPPPSPRREAPAVLPSGWSRKWCPRKSRYATSTTRPKRRPGSTRSSCGRRPCARRSTPSRARATTTSSRRRTRARRAKRARLLSCLPRRAGAVTVPDPVARARTVRGKPSTSVGAPRRVSAARRDRGASPARRHGDTSPAAPGPPGRPPRVT